MTLNYDHLMNGRDSLGSRAKNALLRLGRAAKMNAKRAGSRSICENTRTLLCHGTKIVAISKKINAILIESRRKMTTYWFSRHRQLFIHMPDGGLLVPPAVHHLHVCYERRLC
jgi:hypothetical protein